MKEDFYDVRVNVDSGDLIFINTSLESRLKLTSADFKFISDICENVNRNNLSGIEDESVFLGSSLYIRQSFNLYYQSLAASALHSQTLKVIAQENQSLKEEYQDRVSDILEEFNLDWVNTWARTPNFKSLIRTSHDSMQKFDIDSLGHPGHGATVFDSIQIKLSSRLKNLNIEQSMTPVLEKFDKASGFVTKTFSGLYSDIQKKAESTSRNIDQNPLENFSKAASEQALGFVSNVSSWFTSAKEKATAKLVIILINSLT